MPKNFALNVPVGTGFGAAIDLTAAGTFNPAALKTITVDENTANFDGRLFLEVSGDGLTWDSWIEIVANSAQTTATIVCNFIRVHRINVNNPSVVPILNLIVGADVAAGLLPVGWQAFSYTIGPADGSNFLVNLPLPRSDNRYVVTAEVTNSAVIVDFAFPDALPADRTATQFRTITSAALAVGAQVEFNITPLNP